jgi:hypothetical protein
MEPPVASFTEFWARFTVAACATAASQIHPSVEQTVFMNRWMEAPEVACGLTVAKQLKELLL